ncbi:MAG: DedA family protein [Ktedonobacterales bacterium]
MAIPIWLQHDIELYGYWVVVIAVALESMGVPFPGETSLLAGAIYAGTTGRLSIVGVIAAAAAGAIIGDNIGFSVGHFGVYPLLRKLTRLLRIEDKSLHYTERFFQRHGDKTVFFGRFFSLLRTFVAFLAGVNRMPWRKFLFWNALGGIVWAILYGVLGYVLGHNLPLLGTVLRVLGTGGIVVLVVVVGGLVVLWIVRRKRLEAHLDQPPAAAGPEEAQAPKPDLDPEPDRA